VTVLITAKSIFSSISFQPDLKKATKTPGVVSKIYDASGEEMPLLKRKFRPRATEVCVLMIGELILIQYYTYKRVSSIHTLEQYSRLPLYSQNERGPPEPLL
jgi:hypothetical protein